VSFRLKTILGVAFIEMTLLVILVWNANQLMRDSGEDQLVQRASTAVTLFASMVKDPVISYDLATLETFVTELMKNEGLVYVRIFDQDQMLASAGDQEALLRPFVADYSLESASDQIYDIESGISEAGEQYGRIEMGLSTESLQQRLYSATVKNSSLAVVEIILSALFSFLLGSWLVKQLQVLRQASSEIASGKLGTQIPIVGSDEIAETASYFNQMSAALALSTNKLNRLNVTLEEQVKQRTAELEYAHQSLQSILQSMSEVLLVVDEQGEIQMSNPACTRLLGIEEHQLIGTDIHRLVDSNQQESFDRVIEQQLSSGEEFTLLAADGRRLPVLMMAAKIEGGGDGRSVVTAQDLRELKRAEEGERFLSFQEGLNEMSANILHNIGNNLSGIGGHLIIIRRQMDQLEKLSKVLHQFQERMVEEPELVIPDGDMEKVTQVLQFGAKNIEEIALNKVGKAVNSVERLAQHIGSVIRVTPIGGGRMRSGSSFDLSNLLRDVEILVADRLQEKQIAFSWQLSSTVGRLPFSRNLLLQSMVHLIENSIEAIAAGKQGAIKVFAEQIDQKLLIRIIDNGCGIDPEYLDEVVRAGFSTKGKGGNGLHAVGNYIISIFGEMDIVNRTDGQGVEVRLEIPFPA